MILSNHAPARLRAFRTLAAVLLLAFIAVGVGQEAAPADAPAATLPVTRVVLFTNGIGYFEHRGTVTGTEELELTVPPEGMDDLLQSLVLQDFDGGSVRPVRYASRDPLGRVLAGYALDLSGNPPLAELLVQARGEAVRVEAGETITGRIVGVERTQLADGAVRTDLALATEAGLQRLPLDEVRSLRFENDALRAEFDAALAALAGARGDDVRTVRLRFEGEGERRVRIGYVREMPVWKTSYRLVLGVDESDPAAAELQGWAIADNPTDEELTDVEIAFVAGRPISFVTALYDPVYAPRPRLEVETAPSLAPPADAGAFAPAPPPAAALRSAPAAADALFESGEAAGPEPGFGGGGVEAAAEGIATGATFSYRVQGPVTIGRHQSAMIPIVRQTVQAHELSYWSAELQPTLPLRGVRLENGTGLHLAAGPVSVYGDDGFRGNARLGEVLPGESRILSYAVDPALAVFAERSSEPETVVAVTLRGALLETSVRQRLRTSYRVEERSEAGAGRLLALEHGRTAGFDLVAPEPAPAETPSGYRFGVKLAGESEVAADPDLPVQLRCGDAEPAGCTLEVVEERTEARTVAVANLGGDRVAFYLENVELSPADRVVLERVLALQLELARLDRAAADAQARVDAIFREQERIRQNMVALDRNGSLYRRYLADLEAQEEELDALELRLEDLRAERRAAQERLDALLTGLEADGA